MEMTLTQTPGAFHSESAPPCWRLYRHMAGNLLKRRALRKAHPMVGLTEHRLDASNRIEVIVNHSPHRVQEEMVLSPGWRLKRVLHGKAETGQQGVTVALGGNDACVLSVDAGEEHK
jgi:hypothetical protein